MIQYLEQRISSIEESAKDLNEQNLFLLMNPAGISIAASAPTAESQIDFDQGMTLIFLDGLVTADN